MLDKVPGWVIDDDRSIREEVSEWRDMSPAERWHLAILCSRDAMWAILAAGTPQRILDHVDPLPESSITALARLRERTGWGRGHDD